MTDSSLNELFTPREIAVILRAWDDPVYFARKILHVSLFPKQEEILRRFYETNEKGEPKYNELVLIAGMRSGKTFLGSVIATYELFKLLVMDNPQEYYGLAPNSPLFIMNIASSKDQAQDTVFAQIRARLHDNDFFSRFSPRIYTMSIIFDEKIIRLLALPFSQASVVGRTAKCVIFDELSRYKETEKGVRLLYQSLTRATINFGMDGKRVVITSPLYPNDYAMQLYRMSERIPTMLGLRYPTWEINPKITFDDLKEEREKDPASFWRDYGANPEAAADKIFFKEVERIKEVMTLHNKLEELYMGHLTPDDLDEDVTEYVMAVDPALKNDAFGISIGHMRGDIIYIDGSFRFKPQKGIELSPTEIKSFIMRVIEVFRPSTLLTDVWYFPETLEAVRNAGVAVETHIVNKEDYDKLKEAIFLRKVRLPRYPILLEELQNLQIVNPKKVDHPAGGSKDVADTVANIVSFFSEYRQINMPFFVKTI